MADLLAELRAVWVRRTAELQSKWKRTLPFGDAIVDRWEKAQSLNFSPGVSIYDSAHVYGDVTIGPDTWIGPFVILDGSGGLSIGSFCSVSAGVQIYTHDSVDWALSAGRAPYSHAPTIIGNNCYIGPNTIISKGVTIGDGCVIGANSLVLDSIPEGSRAYGSPCRVMGSVR